MRTFTAKSDSHEYAYRDNIVKLSGHKKIELCMEKYRTVGLCKNIIDLMSDFVSEGVSFGHLDKQQEAFWSLWCRKVNLVDRSERYANNLLKSGIVVLRRTFGSLEYGSTSNITRKNIPLQYVFINPLQVNIYGNKQSGGVVLTYIVPQGGAFSNIPQDIQAKLDKNISTLLKQAQKEKKSEIILDEKYTWYDFYKKDDWETYPDPYIFAAIPDLSFYEQMRKMDLSAMEGVINVIRIWKLGATLPNGKVMRPDTTTISKLNEMLSQAMGGGTADLIWDSMIDLQDTYPPVDKILGSAKYEYVKNEILSDFGIPEILINGKGNGSYSNQFLGLKTMIEKLEYIRERIRTWIMNEVSIVMDALGWEEPPVIRFNNMNLRDDATLGKLILEMFDRGILSKGTSLDYVNESWEVEKRRIAEERAEEEENRHVDSYGPFKNNIPEARGFNAPNNGRPDGTGTPQSVMRDTKPQGS